MPTAQAHARPMRQARHRLSKVASAADTIRGFGHEMDVVGLTYGQFSLLDLVQATLDVTGPADVAISTWSAGLYDVDAARRFVEDGRIRSIRFLMDSATQKRGQTSAVQIADLFGAASIRTTRLHAKFALLENAEWHVLITTSMNLNLNPRIEQFEMTDDADRAALFGSFVAECFVELPPGATDDRTLPVVAGMASVAPALGIVVNAHIATGVRE
jgi:hypothetical protein